MLKFFSHITPGRRLLYALLSGSLASTALAPLYLLPLMYLAFCILGLLAFSSSRASQAFREGFAFGFGYFGISLYWITAAMLVDPNAHGWLAPLALPFVAGCLAVFVALPVAFCAKLPGRISRFLGLVLMLAIGEWLRGYLFQFPWNNFSQSFGLGNVFLQPLAVLGRDGYSLLVLVSLLLPPLALAHRKKRVGLLVCSAAIPVFFAVWGLVRLDQAPNVAQNFWSNAGIRVVQPNIAQKDKLDPDLAGQNLTRLIDLSFADLPGWVGHIIWPEVALHLDIDAYPKLQRDLGALLPVGGTLIPGTLRQHHGQFRNSVIAIDDSGGRTLLHDKVTLVPFGEYVPFGFLEAIAGFHGGGFAAGENRRNRTAGLLPYFSTLICYESIFAGAVRPDSEDTRTTQWLLNVTNDAWFGNTAGPYQHKAISRWRAIEEGVPLVRVANTGISVVFDAYGRVLAERGLGTAGTINIRVPKPLEGVTFYSQHRYGLWFGMLLVLVLGLVVSWLREAKPKLRFEL